MHSEFSSMLFSVLYLFRISSSASKVNQYNVFVLMGIG